MGLIDNLISGLRTRIVGWLEGEWNPEYTERSRSMIERRDYRLGEQKRFLRRSREGFDDNIVGNFLGLALNKSISLLFGQDVDFDFGEEAPEEIVDWIEDIWEANNKPILLHKLAMFGGEAGTVFVKLVQDNEIGWRIVPQDPVFKDVVTDPDDGEEVIRYITQYKYTDFDDREIAKREEITAGNYVAETRRDEGVNDVTEIKQGDPNEIPPNWLIQNFVSSRETGGKWKLVSEEVWPFPKPPVIHWQNLPMVSSVWGMPDLPDDVVELQDKSNFNLSNINRIIRFFAHPFRWSRMFGGARLGGKSDDSDMDAGPEKMPNKDNPAAEIFQLPPVGDVPGALAHAQNLRQMIFDVTRNADITSMKDRIGQLTNFGLKVLFHDALNKLETKRALYGWGLREINRRIFMFSGYEPIDCEIVWENPMPVDEQALRQNMEADLRMGVVDKQTVSERLGYDWETVKARLEEQQQADADIGAMALENFDRFGFGGGTQTIERQRQPVAR